MVWEEAGYVDIVGLPTTLYYGLVSASGSVDLLNTATFNQVSVTGLNETPLVDAGVNQVVASSSTIQLAPTAHDDGLPSYPGQLSYYWTKASGFGDAVFSDSNAVNPTVSFTAPGIYVLQLTVDDGWTSSTDTVTIRAETGDTGTVVREVWFPGGSTISALTSNPSYPNSPAGISVLSRVEGTTNVMDDFGSRFQGKLHVPVTGTYTFWISSDEQSSFQLSSDDTEANLVEEALVSSYTAPLDWDVYAGQKSRQILLQGGSEYFFRILHVESTGGDNLAVAWEGPGVEREVIDGIYVSYAFMWPTVKAGPDQTVTVGQVTDLIGFALDDGLPQPLDITWSKVSGPGIVLFDHIHHTQTTVSFDTEGTYVIKLEATDGQFTQSDTATVTVYPSEEVVEGLVAHWKLDDTTGTDSSGYSNNASVEGATLESSGKIGAALQFSPLYEEYLKVTGGPSLNLTKDLTVSAWIKPSSVSTDQAIVANASGLSNIQYLMSVNSSGQLKAQSIASGTSFVVEGGTIQADTWHHVAVTIDSLLHARVYIDGIEVANGQAGAEPASGSSAVNIGRRGNVLEDQLFDGIIDDVRIYGRALSASEISAIKALGD